MKEPICMCGHEKSEHSDLNRWCLFHLCACKTFTDKRISARRKASVSTREAGPKKAIMELLKERGVMFFRMQSGTSHIGKGNHINMNPNGTADLLALVHRLFGGGIQHWIIPLWIEVKKSDGEQSNAQKEFQQRVEAEGHQYLIARSAQEVADWLQANT